MWLLSSFGYNTAADAVQTETALTGLRLLMSWIPALVAVVAAVVVSFYPLNSAKMQEIQAGLEARRSFSPDF